MLELITPNGSATLDHDLVIGNLQVSGKNYKRTVHVDILLDDPYTSNVHAYIKICPDGVPMVEDAGSTNGTYLNKHRVIIGRRLHEGDRIKIGRTELIVRKRARLRAALTRMDTHNA